MGVSKRLPASIFRVNKDVSEELVGGLTLLWYYEKSYVNSAMGSI